MFCGLLFREKAKEKRNITSWKEKAKGVLPQTTDLRPKFVRPQTGFVSSYFTGGSEKTKVADPESNASSGMGFGTRGEKGAGLKGKLS